MFRVLIAIVLFWLGTAGLSFAADLPLLFEHKTPVHPKKMTSHLKKPAKLLSAISLPAASNRPVAKLPSPIVKNPTPLAPQATSTLSWVLGPMTTNADGGKREGSASATANIIVDKPGTVFGPDMIIELEGHVVKTTEATVRLDIQVGDTKKTVSWNADQTKSGIFKITLNEKVPAGVLPALIPVSALAFVTQTGRGHVAMVSLEKIILRFASAQIVGTK